MSQDKVIKAFAWPSSEPEIAPAPEPTVQIDPETGPAPEQASAGTAAPLPAGIMADSTHAYIWHHAAEAAAVVRTMMLRNDPCTTEEALQGLSARQSAAAFFAGLGEAVGAGVLRHLHHTDEARWVGCAIVEEPPVTHRVAMAALQSVRRNIDNGEYLEAGGSEYATRLFEGAFHRGRIPSLLRPEADEPAGFHAFSHVPAEQLAPTISHEHPQTIALFLSQLDASQAVNILARFPQRLQADVAYRIATLQDVYPHTMQHLSEGMEASFCDILSGKNAVGGPKVVADMLNLTGSSTEKNVMDQIDTQDPEVSEEIRRQMFTFADLDKLRDRELQVVLREADQKDLVVAMKGCGEGLRQRLLQSLSEEVRTFLTAEMEFLEPMRLSEVEEVQMRIVQGVRQLHEQGKLTIVRGSDTNTVWV